MRLFVTIYEPTAADALEAIRALELRHDGIELRAESLGEIDLHAFRAATSKPLLLTHRGRNVEERTIVAAIEAGFEYVDVEWHDALDREMVMRHRERIVLSHHDYDGTPDLEPLLEAMLACGAAQTKIAVTPRSYRDNQRILEAMRAYGPRGGVTLIGMGARGLYSRILAPFFGSELQFVARSGERSAAPGQLTLERALAIYGEGEPGTGDEPRIFAVAGNPAAHSRSPVIHNRLFRERGVRAAYSILDTDSFDDIVWPFAAGAKLSPVGLSITAPFKEEAFAFAQKRGADIGENARECGAVNTLVRMSDREMLADNTDVDGFTTIFAQLCGRDRKTVALVGAGGTARAALVAIRRAGMHVIVYNRTVEKARALHEHAQPLDALASFDGEIIVNTLTSGVDVALPLRPGMTCIEAGYGGAPRPRIDGVQYFDGLELLDAQAVRQHQLFMRVFDESR